MYIQNLKKLKFLITGQHGRQFGKVNKMMINLKVTELKAALECVAKDDIRYYLNGLCIDVINEREAMIVSTNGHYLFACHADMDDMITDFRGKIIIPTESLKMALKTQAKTVPYIVLKRLDDGNCQLGNSVIFKPIDGEFPDYKRVIPQSVSGETGQFNPDYLSVINKSIKTYGQLIYPVGLCHNGGRAAVMYFGRAVCVVMPVRDVASDYHGFTFPEPDKIEG